MAFGRIENGREQSLDSEQTRGQIDLLDQIELHAIVHVTWIIPYGDM